MALPDHPRYIRPDIAVTLDRLQTMFEDGKQKGSKQYRSDEMRIYCHQVVILLMDWLQYEIDEDESSLLKNQSPIPFDRWNNIDLSITAACNIVSHRNGCKAQLLRKIFHDSYTKGYQIALTDPKSRKVIPSFLKLDDVTLLVLGEVISLLMSRAAAGLTTSYRTIITHLGSGEKRHFEVDGAKLGKVLISRFCVRALLVKHNVLKWSDIKKGGKTGGSKEDALNRLWVLRIQIVEYCHIINREEKGEIIYIMMDESYCHERHSKKQSLCLLDSAGKAVKEIQAATRGGLRLCMIGALCRWGHVACTDPTTGKYYRSCNWVDKNNVPVEKFGRFVEYSKHGGIRAAFSTALKSKSISTMKKSELIEACENFIEYNITMNVAALKALLKLKRNQAAARLVVAPPPPILLRASPKPRTPLQQVAMSVTAGTTLGVLYGNSIGNFYVHQCRQFSTV